jgi:CRISPR-associated endonuclease Csn1
MVKANKVYVGLDLGTNSVGWAVSDEHYKILKAKGHSLWGIRLFDEANTAADRRALRTARRREKRRHDRIALLQDIFKDEVSKVDGEFFLRLNNSGLLEEDKQTKGRFSLFNDKGFTDVDYYKSYPTIYHLRQALIEEDGKFDIRLVYLACHHLIKYRGNFLMEGQNFSNKGQESGGDYIIGLFSKLQEYFQSKEATSSFTIKVNDFNSFSSGIVSAVGINATVQAILTSVAFSEEKLGKVLAKALAGGNVKASMIVPSDEEPEEDEKSFSFASGDFDDVVMPELQDKYDTDGTVFVILESIFNWIQFKKILKGKTFLCSAMVSRYKKYGNELAFLKSFVRKHMTKADYDEMFVEPGTKELCNYSAYNKGSLTGGKKLYSKGCDYNAFKKYLNGKLSKLVEAQPELATDSDLLNIQSGLASGDFLKKMNDPANGTIPYQINQIELQEILAKQSKYYPFLTVKDGKYTAAEKIKMLLTFRIPYFVGPLNNHQPEGANKHDWVVRKAQGPITPWNFDDMVDLDKSEDRFIGRMTNKCSYLIDQDVLPKQSLAYQEYLVLNELNNLSLNGQKLDKDLKNEIFEKVYKNNSKVSLRKISEYIRSTGRAKSLGEIELTGLNGEPKAFLTSYIFFKKILGDVNYDNSPMIEEIIKWLNISEDKNRVALRIKNTKEYRAVLTDDQIKSIVSYPCSGWGRLSMGLLKGDDIGWVDPVLGTFNNIIDLMHLTDMNFMSILNSPQFGILKQIDHHNEKFVSDSSSVTYKDVEDLNVSPAVRRPINQALRIVDELHKVTKREPDKIFVEVTREKKDSNKTPDSRKKRLLDYYENIKDQTEEFNNLKAKLVNCSEQSLKAARVYLYFTQLGRCLYSGEVIDFEDLENRNIYDIDHIYPQSLIKDDSLSNRVLVKKTINSGEKKDIYPIGSDIRVRMAQFWRKLHDQNLIDDEKFSRLMRSSPLTDDEINSFVQRQIVTTSQSVKGLISLLKRQYPKAEVVWSKADHASAFRKEFGFVKSRTVNDYHHAQDAYLNIVAGNVYQTKYSSFGNGTVMSYAAIKKQNPLFTINPEKIFQSTVPGAWNLGEGQKDIETVRKFMSHNDILYTQMPYEEKGAFYDMNLSKKGEKKNYGAPNESNPRKDSSKYGGYDNIKIAYFFIAESDGKKGQRVKTIESMPIMYAERFQKDHGFAKELLEGYFGLKNPVIIKSEINIMSPVLIGKSKVILRGKSLESILVSHCIQWNASKDVIAYVHILDKFKADSQKKKEFDIKHLMDSTIQEYEINGNTNEQETQKFIITKEANCSLFNVIFRQLQKNNYSGVPFGSTLEGIQNGYEKFKLLDIKGQVIVLFQMMNLLKCDSTTADLTLIESGGHMGKTLISKNLNSLDISLVYESITGLYIKQKKI